MINELTEGKGAVWNTVRVVLQSGREGPALEQVRRDGPQPASFGQHGFWLEELLTPASPLRNLAVIVTFHGTLSSQCLERSLSEIVRRHEVLRTTVHFLQGQLVQVIHETAAFEMPLVDLRDLDPAALRAEAQRQCELEARKPFDLDRPPMLRARLFRIGDCQHQLVLTIHHLAFDGSAFDPFMRELCATYDALIAGETPSVPNPRLQYADFAAWQRRRLDDTAILAPLLEYWKGQLEGLPPVLSLPWDRPQTRKAQRRSGYLRFVLSNELGWAINRLTAVEGVTPFMILLAAFQALLYRYSGQDDIVVGAPAANRSRAELDDAIGLFANVVALRTNLAGKPSFRELLARVRGVVLAAFRHQELPFEVLVKSLELDRDPASSPVFQVMFAYQNVPRSSWQMRELTLETRSIETGVTRLDLTLLVWETPEGFGGSIEYDADLFDAATIEQMLDRLQRLLKSAVSNPEQRIGELPLLSDAERHWLLQELNDTAIDYPRLPIHGVFEAQVRRTPEASAIVYGQETLTFRELERRSNQLAAFLRSQGAGAGGIVGVAMEPCPGLIVAFLAILKTGSGFLPINANSPRLHVAEVASLAEIKVLLTDQASALRLSGIEATVIRLDSIQEKIEQEADAYTDVDVTPEHVACVMFTSGSSGKPKGVCLTHRGVVRLVKEANYASLSARDVFLLSADVAFDASIFEIWGALLNGATLAIPAASRRSMAELRDTIRRHRVSILFLTTGLFELMVDSHHFVDLPLRQVLVGGDVLSVSHARAFRAQSPSRLINCYGPTEATTFAAFYPIESDERFERGSVPIGKPISNTQIYVLDEMQQPVSPGVVGEAYIGGDGLMRGYLNDSQLTRDRLVPNPFSHSDAQLYRTGDLVRYRRDGNLEFVGRLDRQVKIRGFLVEPGHIESALAHCPLVKRACVVPRMSKAGKRHLVAYVVPQPNAQTKTELATAIRDFARDRLPGHLVPSSVVLIETLPLKSNGKVDRSALPPPDDQTGVEGGPPRDEMERLVLDAFARVLGIQRMGRDDSFFDRGGDSLLALSLFATLKQTLNRNLPLVSLFEHQTVAQFAAFLRTMDSSDPACSPDASVSGPRVVEIKSCHSKVPFFLVPGGTGGMAEMMMYARLMNNLDRDQAVYGLVGSDDASVQERAATYLHQMRMVQPKGPYALGGECVGGIVAFEMAQQLLAQGQEIALLLLMDTWCPGDADTRPSATLQTKWSVSRVGLSNLRRLLRSESWLRVAVTLKQKTAFWLRAVQHIGKTLQYRPKVYPGRVTLLVSSDNDQKGLSEGWRSLCLGGLLVHTVPGDHESYIRQTPEIAAERLSACFDGYDVPLPQQKNPGPPIDRVTFEKMRRIAPHLLGAERATPLPQELAFKLTNRCDLRCTHCYQWNETGYHHRLTKEGHGDLDLSIIAKVLEATSAVKSNVYLWGGEPLVYQDWDGLVDLLANDFRWTSICTNGTLIEKRLESLVRISSHLEVSVSIDGFEKEHDSLRGRGTFRRTMNGLLLLVEQKKQGAFLGEITVNCVITDAMVSRMFEFVQFLEEKGVETVYVSFPWYISEETSGKMDRYYAEHFSWNPREGKPSWRSYNFRLDPNLVDQLNATVARIDAAKWRLKLRYNPRLDADDMRPFIMGSDKPAQNKTRCHAIKTRMDVFPNGDVVSCKFFPEFRMGNLKDEGLAEIWAGERFKQVRQTISQCGLMPVCAKCNLLYTRGT